MMLIAEVMDKMPLYDDVFLTTVILSLLLAVAAAWRPVIGSSVVLLAANFIPWFGPTLGAMNASFEAHVGDSMMKEDPAYFSFARTIPLWYLAGIIVGTIAWVAKRRLRVNGESS